MVRKGGITIYAALILGVMLALIVACLTSAQMAAARAQIAESAEIGLFSIFGQYDRQLLEEFEIFGLNCGGNETAADLAPVCRKCRSYMENVLRQNSQHLRIGKVGISGYRLVTDDGGEPFFGQAVNYEKKNDENRETLNLLRELKRISENCDRYINSAENEEAEDWIARFEAAVLEAENLSREADLEPDGELLETDDDELLYAPEPEYNIIENPVPIIKSISENGIFHYLIPDTQVILQAGGTAGMLSQRQLLKGTEESRESADDSLDSKMLFMCYIKEKTGNYLRKGQAFPVYGMEYILERKDADLENLKPVTERIFRYRMGLNLQEIDENDVYTSETEYLTDKFCSMFRVPPDREIVKNTFRYCWAYGESLAEVSVLLSGGTVSVEDSTAFIVPLVDIYELPSYLGQNLISGEYGSYEDHLLMFLFSVNKAELLTGMMDYAESRIRSSGRPGFFLDHCLADMEISADVRANGRKTFIVTKAYGYE